MKTETCERSVNLNEGEDSEEHVSRGKQIYMGGWGRAPLVRRFEGSPARPSGEKKKNKYENKKK